MRIGQLAKKLGMRTSAIRYYEDLGLLRPPRRVSGRRVYEADSLNALRLIQAAQVAGFKLEEIRQLIKLLENQAQAERLWPQMVEAKIAELEQSISQLQQARDSLKGALDCVCAGRADKCLLVLD